MRKIVNLFLIIFCYFFVASCGEEESNSALSIEAIPDLAFVLPGTDDSCLDAELRRADPDFLGRSITQYRAQFANFKLTWAKKGRKLQALFLRLEFDEENLGGQIALPIDSEELDRFATLI